MVFNKTILEKNTPLPSFGPLISDWETILLKVIDVIIERYQRNPSYHFIDTKLSMLTGEDFLPLEDDAIDFKSENSIFGWIQGRGLESLVGHALWIEKATFLNTEEKETRILQLRKMIEEVFETLEEIRTKNNGHLFFTFSPEGHFFNINDEGQKEFFNQTDDDSTMSDLFYVKGMVAAAHYLNQTNKISEAEEFFSKILKDIDDEKFKGDQVSFDPKNKVKPIPNVKAQGVRMIALGGIAIFAELTQKQTWYDKGCEYIVYLINKHTNCQNNLDLEEYDFCERITLDEKAYKGDDGILCDPGHALEFIGLAAKILLLLKQKNELSDFESEVFDLGVKYFYPLFAHNFELGFQANPGGIIKAFDLASRSPINDDMPWWNLPETMRAAIEVHELIIDADQKADLINAIIDCSNAFFKNFLNESVHLMAYQTVDKNGNPVDIIPATPDADPGYHTGLSIIDFLNFIS
ncbi:MAG: hypothetical protein COA79_00120 [Planctomycetota bacterium]|nr:MAG: hypothetical protein COA79_00120 [Planctomycetota bacterium]